MTNKAATKTTRAAKPDAANGNGQSSTSARPPLEDLTMRAYRATYERLHGKETKQKRQTKQSAPKRQAA